MKGLIIKNCLECPFSKIEKIENGGEIGDLLVCKREGDEVAICTMSNLWCGENIPDWCPLSDYDENKEIYQKGYTHGYTNRKIEEQRQQRETQVVCDNCGWVGTESQLGRATLGLSNDVRRVIHYCPNCGADSRDLGEKRC